MHINFIALYQVKAIANYNLHTSSGDSTELLGGEDWETGHSSSPSDVEGRPGGVTFRNKRI